MKVLGILLMTAFLTITGFGLELKTVNGQVYKKVQVIDRNPMGLYIAYWDEKQQAHVVKEVKFSDLSEKIQKEYNYKPKEAEKYHKHLDKIIAQAAAKAKIREEKKKEYEKKMGKIDNEITNILNGNKQFVKIKIIKSSGSGVICWASSYNGGIRSDLGQIYILGVNEPQGNMWEGEIFPLNNTTTSDYGSYNSYVTPFDRAFGIWKSRYIDTGSLGLKKVGNK